MQSISMLEGKAVIKYISIEFHLKVAAAKIKLHLIIFESISINFKFNRFYYQLAG